MPPQCAILNVIKTKNSVPMRKNNIDIENTMSRVYLDIIRQKRIKTMRNTHPDPFQKVARFLPAESIDGFKACGNGYRR